MTSSATIEHAKAVQSERPTRLSTVFFRVRVAAHQVRRAVADMHDRVEKCGQANDERYSALIAESRSELWSDQRAEEIRFQRGKVENLRRAVEELDCAVVKAGALFSFWKQIGRASEGRGFTTGRMLQQGCVIPAVGGGLCQLSNALYDAALQSGCEIVERHSHSRIVPGSEAAIGRDATVSWNYVDLRFRASHSFMIRARIVEDELVVSFHARPGEIPVRSESGREPPGQSTAPAGRDVASTCGTCTEATCFRKEKQC